MTFSSFISKKDDTILYTDTLQETLKKMIHNNLEYIILLQNKKPCGIITKSELLDILLKKIHNSINIYQIANKNFIQISSDFSFKNILHIYLNFNIDLIIVVDKNNEYIGTIKKRFLLTHPKITKKLQHKKIQQLKLKKANTIQLPHSFNKLVSKFYFKQKSVFIADKHPKYLITDNNIHLHLNTINDNKLSKVIIKQKRILNPLDTINEAIKLMISQDCDYLTIKDENHLYTLSVENIFDFYTDLNYDHYIGNLRINDRLLHCVDGGVIEAIKINDTYFVSWVNKWANTQFKIQRNSKLDNFLPKDIMEQIHTSIANKQKIKTQSLNILDRPMKACIHYYHHKKNIIIKLIITKTKKKQNNKTANFKKLYHDIFNQNILGIVYTNSDGTILNINEYIEDFFGYKKEEIIGQNYSKFVHPSDRKESFKINKFMTDNKIKTNTSIKRYLKKDGQIVWSYFFTDSKFKPNGELDYYITYLQDFTNIYKTQDKLQYQKNLLNDILDTVEDFIFYKDANLKYQKCNQSLLSFLGLKLEDIKNKTDYELFPKSKADEFIMHDKIVMKSKKRFSITQPLTLNGKEIITQTILKSHLGKNGEFLGITGVIKNLSKKITQQKRQQLIQNVFEYADEGIIVIDNKFKINNVNDAFTRISGYDKDDVISKQASILLANIYDSSFFKNIYKTLKQDGYWKGELWSKKKTGQLYTVLMTISAVRDENDKITSFIVIFTDITQMKQKEEQLDFLAHHDRLTNLQNRTLMEINLKKTIISAQKHNHKVAVLYFDLDHFKEINDTCGHSLGDKLLKDVSKRLKRTLKHAQISRVGGDEFVIIANQIKSKNEAKTIVREVFALFQVPFILKSQIFNITATMGISIYPNDGLDAETLLKNADIAMYKAKKIKRNSYLFYTQKISHELNTKVQALNDIKRAIKQQEFVAYYQPQIELKTGKLTGVEALARWQHPQKGLLYPDSFIDIAEQSQDIVHIGKQILYAVCKDIKKWLDSGINLDGFRVAVNISAVQITHDNVFKLIVDATNHFNIDPKYLEIELTETSIMHNPDLAVKLFNKIRSLGVTISIDDFGTGYSSLLYLKKIPANIIKIDRSFIKDIPKDRDDVAITKAILALGKSLNMEIIAEGVEDEIQKNLLLEQNCTKAQGYYYEKPIDRTNLENTYLLKR